MKSIALFAAFFAFFMAFSAAAQTTVQADILKIKAGGEIKIGTATIKEFVATMPATPTATQGVTAPAVKNYVESVAGTQRLKTVITTATNNVVFSTIPSGRDIKQVFLNGLLIEPVIIQSTHTVNFTRNLFQNEQVSVTF
jgi:hypothetical protein